MFIRSRIECASFCMAAESDGNATCNGFMYDAVTKECVYSGAENLQKAKQGQPTTDVLLDMAVLSKKGTERSFMKKDLN